MTRGARGWRRVTGLRLRRGRDGGSLGNDGSRRGTLFELFVAPASEPRFGLFLVAPEVSLTSDQVRGDGWYFGRGDGD
jgi:hypothetical protein